MAEVKNLIPFARPFMDELEAQAASRVILSRWVTQGPEVAAFEKEFAAYVGASYACAVSSCTTALHLALQAVGVRHGDEVITVSHSFIATANSIRYLGAIPVFVDIQRGTYNMDPSLVEAAITSHTRAILCVHQIGMPCDLQRILEIGKRYGLPVVEDAACAVGSEILWDGQWGRIGKPHGDIACFSFHPRKLLSTGDGGMLTTKNPAYDQKFRLWRQHSMSVSDTKRHASDQVIFEAYTELGYNYRLTDIQAAIGREQLKKLPRIVSFRREQVQRYIQMLEGISGLGLPEEPVWARSNWQSFCVRLPEGADQRGVMQTLLDKGIPTRRGVMCAHREPAYPKGTWSCGMEDCNCQPGSCQHLIQSEQAQDRAIMLPLFYELTIMQQEQVTSALLSCLR